MAKKILIRLFQLLLILVVIALAAPFIFKNKMDKLIRKEISQKINAKVDYSNVNISFFRSFPKVSIALDDLQVLGTDEFALDTLLSAKQLAVAVDLMSIIRGMDMNVFSVVAQSPRVHAVVSKTGLVNWDILKPMDTGNSPATEKHFKLQLQRYTIKDGYVSYIDEQAGISGELVNLNHQGTGDFTSASFILKTTTKADAISVNNGIISYLTNAKTVATADIQVDNQKNAYSFTSAEILLNELKIAAKGIIKKLDDKRYDMDIQFGSPAAEFKNILSLIPAIYKHDFKDIKTSGNGSLSGFLKGIYSEKQLPAYRFDMQVNDGFFQYPDLPVALRQINFKLRVDNVNGQPDNTVINMDSAHFNIDKEPFDFRLLLVKPGSNMFVDAAVKGKMDLAKISQFIKLDKGTRLSGLLNANVNVKGNVIDIESQQNNQFSAAGMVSLADFFYSSKDFSGIKINNLLAYFGSSKVDINNLSGRYYGANFIGSGQVNNLFSYLLNHQPLNATGSISADNVNLNNWIGVSADTSAKAPAIVPFVVPADLNVVLNCKIDKLHYDKTDIQNLTGSLQVKDDAVTISDIKGNGLDGSIALNGLYSTKSNKAKPEIALQYELTGVDVQKTYFAFNALQTLMPVSKFITGRLSLHLSLEGYLGDRMMPDMATISGKGNLLSIEGALSKFAPLEKIASTLDVKVLEQILLKDVKTDFEFSNGKILVHPFTVSTNGIDMEIGGIQSFDQSIQYLINMQLHRNLMGASGNRMINNLLGQSNKAGMPVKSAEIVNLRLKLDGSFNSPVVTVAINTGTDNLTDLLAQQTINFGRAKIDSSKQTSIHAIKDTNASIKKAGN